MSTDTPYFPPRGSLPWSPKALNYSPWVCNIGKELGLSWPASVIARVDLVSHVYRYRVDVHDWAHNESLLTGAAASAEQAIERAEYLGKRAVKRLMPAWVKKALSEGWRPPS